MVSLTAGRLTTFLSLLFCIHIAQSESVLSSISTESCSNESGYPCYVSSCDSFPYSCLNASQKNMLLERRCWEMIARLNSVIVGDEIRAENVTNLDPAGMVDFYRVPCCGRACEQYYKMTAYAATIAGNDCNPCSYPVDKVISFLNLLIYFWCPGNQPCQQYNCSY